MLFGNDIDEIIQQKKKMDFEFEIKDLRNLKYFLEMEIARSREGITVSQRKYILGLLTEKGVLGCLPVGTSIEFSAKLGNSGDRVPIDKEKYQHLVGKLIYLFYTRPDIFYAMSTVGKFM